MNYLTNMKNITKLSQQDLHNPSKSSWHDQYKDSAWVYIGGLPFDLTEGDIICIFSQYGEVVNINLIRAKDTGKSKGFCFLCYEDQRSTILAVDNLNGVKVMNRSIRVDHVQNYKVPKDDKKANEETKRLYAEGCAPKVLPPPPVAAAAVKTEPSGLQGLVRETLADQIEGEIKLPARLPIYSHLKAEKMSDTESEKTARKDKKKEKSKKKKRAKKSRNESDDSESEDERKVKKARSHEDRSNDGHADKNSAKYSTKSFYSDKIQKQSSTSSHTHRDKNSSKRKERSKSPDKDDKPKGYKRGFSPSIPKRWR
ncbi:U2 snRNP component ist3 [Dendroctonus ponderosae]|nr:U2 snRNP component ist3 [Dendroctonus ponderosae]KAH1015415.1 hypothetical protein HUJ05_013142 [Dendroctonus ponderosae]